MPTWESLPLVVGHAGTYDESGFLPAADYGGPSAMPAAATVTALETAFEWPSDGNFEFGSYPSTSQPHANTQHHAEYLYQEAMPLEEGAYWYPDDDASMAESEDDLAPDQMEHLQANDLGAIVARHLPNRPFDDFGTQLRTFSNFADANVLSNYFPSSLNSPLTDAQTASVFWYFVNVTGPSMSLFERYPVDPSPIFEGRPVPRSRQHIWTCMRH